MKIHKKIGWWVVKGTPKQIEDMKTFIRLDLYDVKRFNKYFYIIKVDDKTYYFPKERYFVRYVKSDGEVFINYAQAIIEHTRGE